MDLGDTYTFYNWVPDPDLHDAVAIASDWAAVGDDLYDALEEERVGS